MASGIPIDPGAFAGVDFTAPNWRDEVEEIIRRILDQEFERRFGAMLDKFDRQAKVQLEQARTAGLSDIVGGKFHSKAAGRYFTNEPMSSGGPQAIQEERMFTGQTNLFRRGGMLSRAQSSAQAILDERNLSGAGRGIDLLLHDAINPFFTLILTRWMDKFRKMNEEWVKQEVDRRVAQGLSKLNVKALLFDLKRLLKDDPEFRKQTSMDLNLETREAEKGRGIGFWLRGGQWTGRQ